jgi:predicted DNA repair protein MutK
MAGASLLTLLDDIVTALDDVALLTKVAAQKTSGVLGDDLALNAQQVAGVRAEREIPVVWAVAKGSFLNKAILVPAALLISAFVPALIVPLLMAGGLFLCFEGVEKVWHRIAHRHEEAAQADAVTQALIQPDVDLAAFEADKIQGAIRTDFILSAEIIVIALGIVSGQSLTTQVLVLSGIAVAMTVGVYGLVGAIVKLDDAGLWLTQRHASGALHRLGRGLLVLAPGLMKALAVVGTAAMFLVGGGILTHHLPVLHHLVAGWPWLAATAADLSAGVLAGAAVLLARTAARTAARSWRRAPPKP